MGISCSIEKGKETPNEDTGRPENVKIINIFPLAGLVWFY